MKDKKRTEVPETSTTLLRDVADSQHARWAVFYSRYEPKVVADVLRKCGVDEFIFSFISCQRYVTYDDVFQELQEVQSAFGSGAHPFLWMAGLFYDDDSDLKVLKFKLLEGVKLCELGTPRVKKRPKDLERTLSILEGRDVPVQFHGGEDVGCYLHKVYRVCVLHVCGHDEMDVSVNDIQGKGVRKWKMFQ